MIYGIHDIGTYILGTIFIVLLPGPNSLYVMTVASTQGVARGYRGACGIFVGDTVLMLLAASGAASVLRALPALFNVFRFAGAAYLAWIGLRLIRAAWAGWRGQALEAGAAPVSGLDTVSDPFRRALFISLLNPKAILFFISFFIQFVDPAYAWPALSFLVLGLIVQFFSALYLSALIFSGARLAANFARRRRLSASLKGAAGLVFIAFCVRLATASIN